MVQYSKVFLIMILLFLYLKIYFKFIILQHQREHFSIQEPLLHSICFSSFFILLFMWNDNEDIGNWRGVLIIPISFLDSKHFDYEFIQLS